MMSTIRKLQNDLDPIFFFQQLIAFTCVWEQKHPVGLSAAATTETFALITSFSGNCQTLDIQFTIPKTDAK